MPSLIHVLVDRGLVTQEQLSDARQKQIGAKKPILELLIDMGFLKEETLLEIASEISGTPIANLDEPYIDPSVIKLLSYDVVKKYGVFPIKKEGSSLLLAMSDPTDAIVSDNISQLTGMPVKPVLSPKSAIAASIEKYYQLDDSTYDILKNIVDDAEVQIVEEREKGPGKDTLDIEMLKSHGAPLAKFVNLILSDAIKCRATDIHIEPQDKMVDIRYRIDGALKNILRFPKNMHNRLVARVKIVSNLDIAETRKPQDGRIAIIFNDRKVDFRTSIVPTYFGEKIALRILDPHANKNDLNKLGMPLQEFNIICEAITRPNGMIVVVGPTGSGKTTTLYGSLNFIKNEAKNITTIEDPVEYLIEGINQIQINPVKDVTFANSLRSVLRQDPDVILLGEIRDTETAEMALRASLTGHLVFSTLHTNDAVSTVARLLDLGLEPYLIASSLLLVVAQRLVGLICPHCKSEYTPDDKILARFRSYLEEMNIRKFYKGEGCRHCDFTGYFGRTAIFETMSVNENMKMLIANGAPPQAIFQQARENGMRTLAEGGLLKVAEGLTTLEEVASVAYVEQGTAPQAQKEKPQKKMSVLIADDDAEIVDKISRRLDLAGYAVLPALDGEEAIEAALRDKPDLIIMDILMPKMDGFEATRVLRSRLATAHIPIMMLTGNDTKSNELKSFDLGADDYLSKPFDYEKLLARIKMLMKRKHYE